jgi:hypothetical protein
MASVKVKLVRTVNLSRETCYDTTPYEQIAREGITDWEEISEEDYTFLSANLHKIFPYKDIVLLIRDSSPVLERIDNLRAFVEKERKKEEAERKRIEAQYLKRAELERKRKEQRELKKLAALKEKYGVIL